MTHGWLIVHMLGILAAFVAWLLAWKVYAVQPQRAANRRLAVLLAVEGWVAFVLGASNLAEAIIGSAVTGDQSLVNFVLLFVPGTYLLFLATLDTPVARPLRGASGMIVFALAFLVVPVAWFIVGDHSFAGPPGKWYLLMLWLTFGASYGLLAALTALAKARSDQERFRARAYAVAFGLHDVLWIQGSLVGGGIIAAPEVLARLSGEGTPQVTLLLFAPLLAYGILRYRLLGMDLKVKWTLRRSTLLTGLAAVFFVAKEGVETLLPAEGFVPNIAAAAVVGALAYPVWQLTGRLTDRIMPGVEDTASYRDERKVVIYRAQLEEALRNGELTTRERALLARLRESLDLDHGTADRLERELRELAGVVTA